MFSTENRAGRLVELRVSTPVTAAEMAELRQRHVALLASLVGQHVVVTDLRRATVFPAEISDAFITMMAGLNPRLERSAILINSSAILGLQAERAIEEAGNPRRRSFRGAHELVEWLDPVLDAAESARLRLFLAEGED